MTYLIIVVALAGIVLFAWAFNPPDGNIAVAISATFGAAFAIAAGAIPFWFGIRGLWRGVASAGWPTAPGVVLSSGINESEAKQRDSTTYTFHSAEIKVRYQVNGRDYTTENVQFGRAVGTSDSSDAVILTLRYPVGASVPVLYHPRDPSLAVLKPGVDSDVAWFLVAGAVFIVFGVMAGALYFAEAVRWFGLAWVIFMLLGCAMLAPGLQNLWYAHKSPEWPAVKGAIVYAAEGEGSAPVAYQYEVDGTKRFANVRHFGQFARAGGSWAEYILKHYPEGKEVRVAYCPTDPDIATLEVGIGNEVWYLPGAGAAFVLFGLAALILSLRR